MTKEDTIAFDPLPDGSKSVGKVSVFVVLTMVLAAGPYFMMAQTGSTRDYVLFWMWSPGLAALATRFIFERSFGGLGWKLPSVRHLLIALVIPLGYSLLIYVTVWITGLGTFHGERLSKLALFAPVGLVAASLAALGEEIGWRGLMVPELSHVASFTKTAAITGIVWAVWHYPAVLFADYHSQNPRWVDTLFLTVAVMGFSFFTAYLRLSWGSIWPCVVWHAAHNLFIQQIFLDLTSATTLTHYFVDDFGIGVALASLVLGVSAWVLQRRTQRAGAVSVA